MTFPTLSIRFRGAALLALLLCLPAFAGDKPIPSVRYAPSWEDAVDEAKVLNLPIVVHRHGFY